MRIVITHDNGKPHSLGLRNLIVDSATSELVNEWLVARDSAPNEVLAIPNARLHVSADQSGTASLRAGNIIDIREC